MKMKCYDILFIHCLLPEGFHLPFIVLRAIILDIYILTEISLASSERIDFWRKVGWKYSYHPWLASMLFHDFAVFSLRRMWKERGGGGLWGVRRKNSDTAQYLVCPQYCQTTTSHAAKQFSNDLQWDPDPFSLQGTFKITDVVDIMALSHLTN